MPYPRQACLLASRGGKPGKRVLGAHFNDIAESPARVPATHSAPTCKETFEDEANCCGIPLPQIVHSSPS